MPTEQVLVTGGTGFVGVHCIALLIEQGYRVRTTVRSLTRESGLRAMLTEAGVDASALEVVAADLTDDAGWPEAVVGCAYVLHVASPFPVTQPKDANELIVPARDGALRVLRAARDAAVQRVVLTSSFAAVGYGHGRLDHTLTEEDWTDLTGPNVSPYVQSKTLAERAAWDFIDSERGDLQLAVVNPVAIFGPVLSPDLSTSIELLQRMLAGKVPALPHIEMSAVDVRDVADLHVRAMTHPDAAGQRFIAAAGDPLQLPEMARILRDRLGAQASRVPTRTLHNWIVRTLAPVNRTLRDVAPLLGDAKQVSHEKAVRMLGWAPRSNEDAVLASAESLVRFGLTG
ncbi:SDR family oxidoreductase [Rathayibacter soli]|uniref:SDR family oxidoreductase n=1 Tax=Rathayibacter soli TaxID=3144168 RepID=UPI0027E5AA74|nr:aldehyde reductase [Glaciibacter superstes]